jgi:hypothetical protein
MFLCALAAASALLRRSGRSLTGELGGWVAQWHLRANGATSATRATETPVGGIGIGRVWPGVAGLICAVPGYRFIRQPVRYDEAFTFLFFVNGNWPALFYYPLPNNHVLYSLLAKLSVLVAGAQPWAWRLPALAASVASVFVLFRACRKLSGPQAGYLAAAAIATWPLLVLYSSAARGYSLQVLLTLLMIDAIVDQWSHPERSRLCQFSLLAGLGMLTMPSMAFAISGLGLWMCLLHWLRSRSVGAMWRDVVLPGVGLTLLFTVLFYVPVLLVNRLSAISDGRFFTRLAPDALLEAVGSHAAASYFELTRGVGTVHAALLWALFAFGIAGAVKHKNRALFALAPACLFGSAALLLLKGSIPYPRTWIYFVPVFLITADAGFAFLISGLSRFRTSVALLALLSVSALLAWRLAEQNAIEGYPDSGAAPGASAMAGQLTRFVDADDWLCARAPFDVPLQYYLWARRYDATAPAWPGRERVFYVVPGDFAGTATVRPQDLTMVARVAGLSLYRMQAPARGNDFAKSFHCWFRGSTLMGAVIRPSPVQFAAARPRPSLRTGAGAGGS